MGERAGEKAINTDEVRTIVNELLDKWLRDERGKLWEHIELSFAGLVKREELLTIVNKELDRRMQAYAEAGEILDMGKQLRAEGLSVGEIRQRLDEKFGPVGKGKEG
jgi:pimeloyl-CoA synthetase